MTSIRRTAIVAGVFFLITEVTAIAGVLLYGSVLGTPDFIVSTTADNTGVRAGAFLEVLLAIAVAGTAVTLYPIVKRQNEAWPSVTWRDASSRRRSSPSVRSACSP